MLPAAHPSAASDSDSYIWLNGDSTTMAEGVANECQIMGRREKEGGEGDGSHHDADLLSLIICRSSSWRAAERVIDI